MRPVRKGDRFLHSHWIMEVEGRPVKDWPPEICEVTKTTGQRVYYRTVPGGFLAYSTWDRLDGNVKKWLPRVS